MNRGMDRNMKRKFYGSAVAFISLTLILLPGCGSGSSSHTPAQPAIAATSGMQQSAAVNTSFSAPLVATVTTGGSPTNGMVVTFTAPSTGASGTFAGGTTTATATTNASGVATSPVFTANSTEGGPYTVTASATGATGTASFSLTNTVGAPASITASAGASQSTSVDTPFSTPFAVTVVDSASDPVSGVVVTFTAPGTGASGTFAGGGTTVTATTNASGLATSAVFTANGTLGTYAVTASAAGVTTPATFNLTNVVGVAASIAATSGTPQSAKISQAFASPLVATVVDSGMNPVSGVVVTFTAPTTGASGTFAGGTSTATATTSAGGVATSSVFTANSTAGSYTVTATASGTTGNASFILSNTTQSASAILAQSGTPQSTAENTAFATQLAAKVVDVGLNPVSGVVVTFTAPSTGASGTFAGGVTTATTNASGLATAPIFTANGTLGSYTVSATAAGVSTPAVFNLTNTVGAPASISVTSGTPQSATVMSAFSAPLVATVLDSGSNPVSGVTVTFTPPSTGASGAFAGGVTTATTDANGVATSAAFTANANVGSYTVTASVTATPANLTAAFSLTNVAANYSFYLSGQEASQSGARFYSLAGAVTLDGNGNVLGGEQDYNDAAGVTSPESSGSSGDTITGGSLAVDPTTGQGTLTLITNNTALGVSGTETLGLQFVNSKHALAIQFDGTATSSGSLDFQTLPTTLSGNYAFTFSGVDPSYYSVVYGGVFSINGTALQNGIGDADDFGPSGGPGNVSTGVPFTGTISTPDAYGRGTITNTGIALTMIYYVVGPEVIRMIDVDTTDSGVGSAYGQGTATFDNTSIGSSVFGIQSNSIGSTPYVAAGMFTSDPTGPTFSGVADVDEAGSPQSNTSIAGTYAISNSVNGYGTLTITGGLENVTTLGIYLTDPTLNLSDPNDTTDGLGGALLADLDTVVTGTGILIPQTDPSTASFTGSYAFGAHDFNSLNFSCNCDSAFDFVGLGSVTNLSLTSTSGLVSDPFFAFPGTPAGGTDSAVTFDGTVTPDPNNLGRYTMPLVIETSATSYNTFSTVLYQASGQQLLWLNEDGYSVFLGSLQQQGSLTALPAIKKRVALKKVAKAKR